MAIKVAYMVETAEKEATFTVSATAGSIKSYAIAESTSATFNPYYAGDRFYLGYTGTNWCWCDNLLTISITLTGDASTTSWDDFSFDYYGNIHTISGLNIHNKTVASTKDVTDVKVCAGGTTKNCKVIYKDGEILYARGSGTPNYLTFTANTANSSVTVGYESSMGVQYQDSTGWHSCPNGTTITLASAGDCVKLRGLDTCFSIGQQITMTGSVAASGSVTSLLDFYGNDSGVEMGQSQFYGMFYGCTSLTTAPSLPATTLADDCYAAMFYGCTSLTTAPSLPATTLADECYFYMFYGCTSLTTAPSLPATTLADVCYAGMFTLCTSLTTAPSLPATTLADDCYAAMFNGCTSLTTAPSLPATTLAELCYARMFSGCTNLASVSSYQSSFTGCTGWLDSVNDSGVFYSFTPVTIVRGSDGIPSGWDVVVKYDQILAIGSNGVYTADAQLNSFTEIYDGTNFMSAACDDNGSYVFLQRNSQSTSIYKLSNNSTNMSYVTQISDKRLCGIAYGNGAFCASGSPYYKWGDYSHCTAKSLDGGSSWTIVNEYYNDAPIKSVAHGNGRFVCCGGQTLPNSVAYSDSAFAFTQLDNTNPARCFYDVAYGNGRFVGVHGFTEDNTARASQLTDGSNVWYTLDTSEVTPGNTFKSIVFGGNTFIVVDDGGYTYRLSNGETVFRILSSPVGFSGGIVFYGNKFIAIANNGYAYSLDMANDIWRQCNSTKLSDTVIKMYVISH